MNGAELIEWLSALAPSARDAAVEGHLGIHSAEAIPSSPGEHLIGYHPSGVAAIVRALLEVPVMRDDVVVDLGSGLGKVALLTRLLTGAAARGVEIDAALVHRARRSASRLGLDVEFTNADARDADLDRGTVFFLYVPFTGPVLRAVLERLREIASRRAIVVCALGFELDRDAPWLVARPTDSFWLTLYDSAVPGAAPRPTQLTSPLGSNADALAFERSASERR